MQRRWRGGGNQSKVMEVMAVADRGEMSPVARSGCEWLVGGGRRGEERKIIGERKVTEI